MGVTAGTAAVSGGSGAGADQTARDVARWATPEEQWAPSICQQCPGGCGLLVRTMDGDPVGLRGNPFHPVNRGALCAKPFGALEALRDPHRYRGPLALDGERGSGRFKPIGWDEALDRVARRLGELRAQGLSHTVAVLGGQYRGHRDTLWQRFSSAYGTPNYIRVRCLAPERPALAHRLMHGATSPLAYDLGRAAFVLAFGTGLVESWLSPVHAGLALSALRGAGGRPRGTLVVVDPRRSLTAAAADRWIPIRPGTDGILAMGLAHVLIREELHDRRMVERETSGFEDWTDTAGRRHRGFKSVALQDYGPLAVAEATGVPVDAITGVARELARARPAIVLGERGPAFGPADLATRLAVHALNALVGSLGVEGGLLAQGALPLASLPAAKIDETAERGVARPRLDGAGQGAHALATDAPQALAGRILSGAPYAPGALFLAGTNPVASLPAGGEMARALGRIPLVVSFSPFPDESSRLADLVLPDHSFLERWQDDPVTHLAGFTCWSLGRPALPPLHQTRSTPDVLLQIARRLGGSVAESLGWEKYEDLLYESAKGLYDAERGYVVAGREEEWVRKLQERQGYWSPEFDSYDDFWDALGKRGAWWDPADPPLSRRAMLAQGGGRFRFAVPGAGAEPPLVPEPPFTAPEASADFPLTLSTFRPATRPQGGGRNQPTLMENPAAGSETAWRSWVEVHPEDARAAGLRAGDEAWVESAAGRLRLLVRVTRGTMRGVVHVPVLGAGAQNPNALIPSIPDPTRGLGLFGGTRVRIRKA